MKLKNKIALVTGSSRGVGRAVALGYAGEGAKVVVNYTSNQKAADEVVQAIQDLGSDAIAVKADVARKSEVENLVAAAVDKFGRLDILVNNGRVYPAILDAQDDRGPVGSGGGYSLERCVPLLPSRGYPDERTEQRKNY